MINTEAITPIRQTRTGTLKGIHGGDYYAWLGIPYAIPPVGELRWRAPRPLPASTALIETTSFGSMATQANAVFKRHTFVDTTYVGSEDCLYLNLWTPSTIDDNSKLPVMVWIHGGGNIQGSGNINGAELAVSQHVIVVSMNYRLGPFGWLSHAALREGDVSAEDISGNYGTLDIIQALQWVQDNIAQFGGNPDCVTIMGLSAGAWNVFSLLNSPKACGLFHRAIAQSGWPLATPCERAEQLMDELPAGHPQSSGELLLQLLQDDKLADNREQAKAVARTMTSDETAEYLRSTSYQQLHWALGRLAHRYADDYADQEPRYQTKLSDYLRTGNSDQPKSNQSVPKLFLDGEVIAKTDFYQSVASGQVNQVPVLLGTTRDESKLFQTMDKDFIDVVKGRRVIKDLPRYEALNTAISTLWQQAGAIEPARALHSKGSNAFVYRFDWGDIPSIEGENRRALFGATHGLDGACLFADQQLPFIDIPSPESFTHLSKAMMSYWAAFAETGNPGKGRRGELPEWRCWQQGDSNEFMVLDATQHGLKLNRKSYELDSYMMQSPNKQRLYLDIANYPLTF